MKITILSLFPEMLSGFFESSIMKRAVDRGLISYNLVNIRDYATDKHRKCDDEVFGGGAGMLLLPAPLGRALDAAGARPADRENSETAASRGPRTVFVTPSGRLFNQAMAQDFSREQELVIICGHYEGMDQRIVDRYVSDEVSIGDYVLSSGEVAALVLVDAIFRLIPGVIKEDSLLEESFSPRAKAEKGEVTAKIADGTALDQGAAEGKKAEDRPTLLEYPQYTRPAKYDTMEVPEVLTSGHHANIVRWRLKESVRKTLAYRPELLATEGLPSEVRKLLREILIEGGKDEPHTDNSGAAD